MKNQILFLTILSLASTALLSRAEEGDISEASKVGILPHQKKTLNVPPDERNPFSVPVVGDAEVVDSSTEEAQLRGIVRRLPIGGVTPGNRGLKVLLGSMIIEQGHYLPDLFPGQANRLLVSKVSRKEIELTVVDEDGAEQQEKIRKEFDLANDVHGIHPGGEGRTSLHPLDLERHRNRVERRYEEKNILEEQEMGVAGDTPRP
ncbi:MAG: hypothetical protein AAGA58_17275 [Verrucomicrobiota bacterium]